MACDVLSDEMTSSKYPAFLPLPLSPCVSERSQEEEVRASGSEVEPGLLGVLGPSHRQVDNTKATAPPGSDGITYIFNETGGRGRETEIKRG
jgi:hypothetical protein